MLFKKGTYKFKGRVHSKRGIISMLLAITALIVFLIISFISGKNGGNGGTWIGVVGLFCTLGAVIGFILSIKSFREKDIYLTAPIIGIGLNGILVIVFFSLYIVGVLS